MKRFRSWCARAALLPALGFAASCCAQAQSDDEEMAQLYGDKDMVSIATGAPQPLRRAPSVATVITAEDIRVLGATDLDQVLETVPGLHVTRSPVLYAPIYIVRGVRSGITDPEVLLLVNGIPLTQAYSGGPGLNWGGWPVEDIERIEVIRGPGSALYGADAFSGVINIITKGRADIDGTQLGGHVGNWNTRDAWLLHGGRHGPFDVALSLSAGRTDGPDAVIAADAQSALDAVFAPFGVPPASHAPGRISGWSHLLDASIDVAVDRWRWRAAFDGRRMGTGAGVAQALDPTGYATSQRLRTDLTWSDPALARDWALTLQGSFMRYGESGQLVLFPSGANLGGGFFADGMIGDPSKYERQGRLSASAFYTGLQGHRVRVGAGWDEESLYRITEFKNFNPDFSPIGTGSTADVTDVTETVPYIHPHSRTVAYAYAQDEWRLADDWTFTAGLRSDHYSDFGTTTNPRFALVWEAAYNVTAKLLYGSAFRAPAFLELYLINNPTAIGNPDLKPERIHTLEGALSWQPTPTLQAGVNVFHYEIFDIVRQDGQAEYQNMGSQDGSGLELEATWDPMHNLRMVGQFALQHSFDELTRHDAGMAPHQTAQLRAQWTFLPGWHLDPQVDHVGARARVAGDPRPALAGYTTFDLSLQRRASRGPWEFGLTVHNLFKADAREPSPFGAPFTSIPNDLPLGGRSFVAEARYRI